MNNTTKYWLGVAGVEINIKLFVFNSSFTLTEIPEETASRIERNKQLEHKKPFEVLFKNGAITVVFLFSEKELNDLDKLSCVVSAEEQINLRMRMGKTVKADCIQKDLIGKEIWLKGSIEKVDHFDMHRPVGIRFSGDHISSSLYWIKERTDVMFYED